jgi:hypothetical protein
MKIFLRCAGGIGNVRVEGQVDTSDLDHDLAQRVERVLSPAQLTGIVASKSAARSTPSGPFMADAQEVELAIHSATAEPQKYQLNEAELSDEVLEVLDELRYEITRQKAAALGRELP